MLGAPIASATLMPSEFQLLDELDLLLERQRLVQVDDNLRPRPAGRMIA